MKTAILLLFTAALAFGQIVPMPIGVTFTQGDISAVIMHFSCSPIPGVPLGPDSTCQPSTLVSVHTGNPDTAAFKISIKYIDASGEGQTASLFAGPSNVAQATRTPNGELAAPSQAYYAAGLEGWPTIVSLLVTPMKAMETVRLGN